MAKLPVQSARFKKDVVVGFAFGLFFLTMAAEVILAVLIPYHLRFDNVWQVSIARQKLFSAFDSSRTNIEIINEQGSGLVRDENALLAASFNRLASYLHNCKKSISEEQCQTFQQTLQKFSPILGNLRNNRSYTHELTLDATAALQQIAGTAAPPPKKAAPAPAPGTKK